jgi:hypothetical protein
MYCVHLSGLVALLSSSPSFTMDSLYILCTKCKCPLKRLQPSPGGDRTLLRTELTHLHLQCMLALGSMTPSFLGHSSVLVGWLYVLVVVLGVFGAFPSPSGEF